MEVRCIVACRDSSGVPTFVTVTVTTSAEDYGAGEHYYSAEDVASDLGYTPYLVYDDRDLAEDVFSFLWDKYGGLNAGQNEIGGV